MPRRIPSRNYLTFSELLGKWQRTENDLRYAIICGEIKPSIRLTGKRQNYDWNKNEAGDWVPVELRNLATGEAFVTQPRGWHYLQDPMQTGPFDCEFSFAADGRTPDKSDLLAECTNWFLLKPSLTLADVKNNAVFLFDEIELFEEKFGVLGETQQSIPTAPPLKTRERDTLLTIIAALAKAAKISIDSPGKAALYIESLTDTMGTHVSKRTIEEHLKKIPDALEIRLK